MIYIVVYVVLAAIASGFVYWGMAHRPVEYKEDHDYDVLVSVGIGCFFPVALPFYVSFSVVKKLCEKENKK